MILLLVHGWGFDRTLWADLRAALKVGGQQVAEADFGYFGDPSIPQPTGPVVAIGHSFGAMWLLRRPPPHCVAFIAINGFDRFTEGDGSAGTARRVVDRMLTRFDAAPEAVTDDFRRRCGATRPTPGGLRPGRLREDLLTLRDGDERAAARAWSGPMLSLQGGRDPILPAALRDEAFGGAAGLRRAVRPEAGHLLPLTDAPWCAAEIRRFLEPLALVS